MIAKLKDKFIAIGVAALIAYFVSRLMTSVLLTWLSSSGWLDATSGNTTAYVSLYTIADILDFLSKLLWGLFFIGFAMRVIELLENPKRD